MDAKTERDQMPDNIAPAGKLWVCHACGKTARDRYGEESGWDESCMLNSSLEDEDVLIFRGRRVIEIKKDDQ